MDVFLLSALYLSETYLVGKGIGPIPLPWFRGVTYMHYRKGLRGTESETTHRE